MTTASSLRQSHDVLKASLADLGVLRDQLAGIESIDAERARVKAAPTPRTFINEAVVPEREVQSARERADRRWHMNEERTQSPSEILGVCRAVA